MNVAVLHIVWESSPRRASQGKRTQHVKFKAASTATKAAQQQQQQQQPLNTTRPFDHLRTKPGNTQQSNSHACHVPRGCLCLRQVRRKVCVLLQYE
jgi:hypothetical protein